MVSLSSSSSSSSSSPKLFSNLFFLLLIGLVLLSFIFSIGLGFLQLWNDETFPLLLLSSSSELESSIFLPIQQHQQQQQQYNNHNNNILNNASVNSKRILSKGSTNNNNNSGRHLDNIAVPMTGGSSSSNSGGADNNIMVPYYPPFAPIPNGEQLAAAVLDGTHPTVAGIVHILQMFLRDLRNSNKANADVSNDRAGETTVRTAYLTRAKKHLVPFDSAYRNRNIFPVRIDEESIFISLAAFREHLLYDTLAGAFRQAKNPNKIHVGVVVQNCFGFDDQTGEPYGCKTGAEVIGKDPKTGRDMTKVSDKPPDVNGVEQFCNDNNYKQYCIAGQITVLNVHEQESLGPAVARYYASKLWGGQTYFLQADSHLKFTPDWDIHYINELKATSNYPKSILSMYPPGFDTLDADTPGTRLCTCVFSENGVEDHIIRINNGMSYPSGKEYARPTQIPFIAAGFFFTRAEFLKDVPFDPFLPWCFMGEEIALSMRAWTSGWNIYAPRKNWIAHQYRPGRMGLPKFWGSVGRTFHRGLGFSNRLQSQLVNRIKYMVGYPEVTKEYLQEQGFADVLEDMEYYGLGTERKREEYIQLTNIDFDKKKCKVITWCNQGTLD